MASNYPPGVTGMEPQMTGVCAYCGEEACGEENVCPDRGAIYRRQAAEAEANGMDRLAVLDAVTRSKQERDEAANKFREQVIYASGYGCSIREIAEAAGYDSHSSIQKILDKHT